MAKYPQIVKKHEQFKRRGKYPIPQSSPVFSFEDAFGEAALERCYKRVKRGYRNGSAPVVSFDRYAAYHIRELHKELMAIGESPRTDTLETYQVGKYHTAIIHEPKERHLSIPEPRDKIVQLAAHDVLVGLFRPTFTKQSYACISGRGQIRAVLDVMHDLRSAKAMWGDKAVIVRVDVKKFFYSIDREILKKIIRKRFKHLKSKYPDMYGDLLRFYNLISKIIDSSPEGATGISLGNVTSQDLANIYLNELDLYCVRFLGIHLYRRYMDDIIAIAPDKETAKDWLNKIISFLSERLNLDINEKTKLFRINQGVNAFGYKIKTTHLTLRTASKRRMQRKAKMFSRQLAAAEARGSVKVYHYIKIRAADEILRRCNESFAAWIGFARWACCFNLVKREATKHPELHIYAKSRLPFGTFCRIPKHLPKDLTIKPAA